MSSRILRSSIYTMFATGVILLPTATLAVVPPAVQDLQDLKTVIDSSAATINAAPTNTTWGFFTNAPAGTLGTADLISNITTTLLRAQYRLNTNKTDWLTPPNTANSTNTTSPTLPPVPVTPPTNITLDNPYIDYVTSIPTLSTALTTLGRSYHKELNQPVSNAIAAFQQTITAFSNSLLAEELIKGPSIIRTIRASSTLEDAQQAWSKFLNLPGSSSASGTSKRSLAGAKKPLPKEGSFYSHKDLWGRKAEVEERQAQEGGSRVREAVVRWEEEHGRRMPSAFVA